MNLAAQHPRSTAAPRSPARGNTIDRDARWQLRLVITLPALLILFTLGYGLISYLSFSAYWDELDRLGSHAIASQLLRTHLVAMLALTALALVMGVALSSAILRPINAIMQASRQVAEGRLDQHTPPIPAARELNELSQSFNAMIDQLNRSIAERNDILSNLPDAKGVRDLSAHLNHTDRLAALGTFTLGLADELRNPLGAIKGLGQLLQLEREMPSGAGDYIERMIREIDRIDAFVSQLLDLCEQPIACAEETDPAQMLSDAAEQAHVELEPRLLNGVKLVRRIDGLNPIVIQRDRLTQALARIIRNAYEATPAGGRITLGATHPDGDAHALEIRIHNTGSAIDSDRLDRVFEPFFTTRDGATGLGLTIANQIVVQCGGRLEVESDASGVTFIATLAEGCPTATPALVRRGFSEGGAEGVAS